MKDNLNEIIKEKRCRVCGKVKLISEFNKNACKNDGYNCECKECSRKYIKQYYLKNKEKWKTSHKKTVINNPIRNWCRSTRARHKNDGFIVMITNDELEKWANFHKHCEFCGIELDFTPFKGKSVSNSPSLDRTNNEQEIRLDNITMLCRNCNHRKGDMPLKDYLTFCKNLLKKFG